MAAARKNSQREPNEPHTTSKEPIPIDRWPSKAAACRIAGVSLSTLERMLERGEVFAEKDAKGVWRYDPDMLHDVATQRQQADALGAAAVIEASHGLVSQAQGHAEQLVKHVTGPGLNILELQSKLLQMAYDENAKLRQKNFEMLEAHERSMSLQHEREMHSKVIEEQEKRRSEAWTMAMKLMPGLVDKGLTYMTNGGNVKKVVDALVEIPDEFVEVFAKMDILKPEQLDAIKTLRKAHPGRAKSVAELEAAHAAKESETTPEQTAEVA